VMRCQPSILGPIHHPLVIASRNARKTQKSKASPLHTKNPIGTPCHGDALMKFKQII